MPATVAIKIRPETKSRLDEVKRPGQTYDGALQELLAVKK